MSTSAETADGATPEVLVKSRQRVADHGEVFTPSWLVDDMLDLVKEESERIDSRFLEPACGSGNFLIPVLRRKLATVEQRFGSSEFERHHHGLLGLMCIYGIELLADNAAECRGNLLDVMEAFFGSAAGPEWMAAARAVVGVNIVQGNALDMTTSTGDHITFPEWGYLGKGKFQRRDFQFGVLAKRAEYTGGHESQMSIFEAMEEHDVFTPSTTFPPMTVKEIGQ